MTNVREEKITNSASRRRFYNIPTAEQQIAKRQLTFIGKIARNSDCQLPTKLLTAWCNHPRPKGGVLHTNKKSIVANIRIISPNIGKTGALREWIHLALDDGYWKYLIANIGRTAPSSPPRDPPEPAESEPAEPEPADHQTPNTPPNTPPNSRPPPTTPNAPTPETPPRQGQRDIPLSPPIRSPPPRRPTTPPRERFHFDPANVGKTKMDSLRILRLENDATERQVKTQYRRLARIYHPDKFDRTSTRGSINQAEEHFKLLNNAYEYLRNN